MVFIHRVKLQSCLANKIIPKPCGIQYFLSMVTSLIITSQYREFKLKTSCNGIPSVMMLELDSPSCNSLSLIFMKKSSENKMSPVVFHRRNNFFICVNGPFKNCNYRIRMILLQVYEVAAVSVNEARKHL